MKEDEIVGSDPLDPKDTIVDDGDDDIIDKEDGFPDTPDDNHGEDEGDSGTSEEPVEQG